MLRGTKDLRMNRALELFNKTNQFNTTGERYTFEECHERFVAARFDDAAAFQHVDAIGVHDC